MSASPKAGEVRTVTVGALREAQQSGEPPQLIDVRTPGEYRGGHVPGAINLPLGTLDPSALDAGRPVWLICRTGGRSAQVAAQVAAAGHAAVNVIGGTLAWRAAGLPLDPPNRPPNLLWPALASLTLGLAPFQPEPHVIGKLRWVLGGAEGMALVDWLDLAMHGAPWVWLLIALVRFVRSRA